MKPNSDGQLLTLQSGSRQQPAVIKTAAESKEPIRDGSCSSPVDGSSVEVNNRRVSKMYVKDVGFWAWLVCLTSFLTNGIMWGIVNSAGIIFADLPFKNQEESRLLLSLPGSICVGMTFLCSTITSIIVDVCGMRATAFVGGVLATLGMFASAFTMTQDDVSIGWLCFTYGIVLGLGFSLAYAPSLVILSHYFEKNLGIANGIVTAGSSTFTFILPLFLPWIRSTYGIQYMFKFLSGIIALLTLCSLTFIERPAKVEKHSDQLENLCQDYGSCEARTVADGGSKVERRRGLINTAIWKNKLYVLWALAFPTALFGYFVPYMHLKKLAEPKFTGKNLDILVTFIGAFSGIGRLVFGTISDFPCISPIALQQIAFIAIGIIMISFTLASNYYLLIFLCCAFGLFDGCFISLIGPIAHDLVGQRNTSQAIGFLLGFCSFPLTVGPPVAGYLFDKLKNYTLAFILSGCSPFLGAVLMLPILIFQRRETNKKKYLATVACGITSDGSKIAEVRTSDKSDIEKSVKL